MNSVIPPSNNRSQVCRCNFAVGCIPNLYPAYYLANFIYIGAIFNWALIISQDCFGFALLRCVIGSENSHHLLNQSDATWLPAFSRALGSSFVFTRNFHWLMMMNIPAVIGRCYYFCFGTSSFNWKLLLFKHLFKATLLSLPSSWKRNVKYVFLKSALCWMILDIHQQEIFLTIEVQLNRSPFASCLSPVLQFSLSAYQLVVLNHEGLLEDARSLYCLKCQRECLA